MKNDIALIKIGIKAMKQCERESRAENKRDREEERVEGEERRQSIQLFKQQERTAKQEERLEKLKQKIKTKPKKPKKKSQLLKKLSKLAKKKVVSKRIIRKSNIELRIPNRPVVSNFDAGSSFFLDTWEKTKKEVDPLADDGFFWR